MSDEAITNSACLIVLERIGRLELLPGLFTRVWAPPEVVAEIGVKPPWLEMRDVENRGVIAALMTQVEEGEAATMALALEMPGVPVILDDKKARRIARQLGLDLIGTLAILVRAKRNGAILAVEPLIAAMQAAGFHTSKALRDDVLRLAGETPA